jgi:c-di-GMP-binding flagellar brake protein YcgR
MERRSHPRVKVSCPVLYTTHTYPCPRVATATDLSLGGTRIEKGYYLTKSAKIQVSIVIPSHVIKCKGKVMYILLLKNERLMAGVQFEGLSAHDKRHLGQYISYIMSENRAGGSLNRG